MPSKIYPFTLARTSIDLIPRKMAWINQNSFCQSMKPLLWCLKITGLLPGISLIGGNTDSDNNEITPDRVRIRSCSGRVYTVYSIVVILILWYNLALSLTAFVSVTQFNGTVCNQIITSMWFLQIAYCSVCNFFVCKHLKVFCDQFDDVAKSINFTDYYFIRKCAIGATVLYIIWLLIAFTFTGLGSYFLAGNVAGPFGNVSVGVEIIVRIAFLVTYFYFTSTWYLIVASFFVVSLVLTKSFRHFNRNFKKCFEDGKFKGDIETIRMQHEHMTRLLFQADKVFSMYVMSSIGTVIPLIIFTLYFLLFESIDVFSFIATLWSACLSIIQMMVVFLGGGFVNHEAHAALEHIYGIDMNVMGPIHCHQMNVFLSKLTANPIGFTAFGLFTIDKPTIIAFASSIVTYTVVVIQFKPASPDPTSSLCNCTLTT
ncbi:uncharacterized protein LOC127708693 [Mytilus californianus]|uniref:uncharacterized protein LOC127708693 n=1 Tax=Mytilus californianus TaxID=6549 RepID=UPI002247BD21|nr:uncharacterized protein LOC127708693 [Mytilus californianus]